MREFYKALDNVVSRDESRPWDELIEKMDSVFAEFVDRSTSTSERCDAEREIASRRLYFAVRKKRDAKTIENCNAALEGFAHANAVGYWLARSQYIYYLIDNGHDERAREVLTEMNVEAKEMQEEWKEVSREVVRVLSGIEM